MRRGIIQRIFRRVLSSSRKVRGVGRWCDLPLRCDAIPIIISVSVGRYFLISPF